MDGYDKKYWTELFANESRKAEEKPAAVNATDQTTSEPGTSTTDIISQVGQVGNNEKIT